MRDVRLRRVEPSFLRARAVNIEQGTGATERWGGANEMLATRVFCAEERMSCDTLFILEQSGLFTHTPVAGSVPGTAHRVPRHARSAYCITHTGFA